MWVWSFPVSALSNSEKRYSRINGQDPTNLTHCDVKSSWYNSMLGSNNCYILSIIAPFLLHLW